MPTCSKTSSSAGSTRRLTRWRPWQAGELEVTVFQNAGAQGGGGVEAAVKLVNGEPIENMVDGVIDVPYEPVTPENMADYMN